MELTCDQLIDICRAIIWEKESRKMRLAEESALRAGWERINYEKYVEDFEIALSPNTLKQQAHHLYSVIREAIGNKKLNKTNLKASFKALYRDGKLNKYQEIGHHQYLTQKLNNLQPQPIQAKELHFIGRTSELEQLSELTAQKKCIQVWGEAGIGKSTLISQFSNGISTDDFYILETQFRKDLAINNWAQEALNLLNIGQTTAPLEDLIHILNKKSFFLVIDNAQYCTDLFDLFISNFIYTNCNSIVIVISNIYLKQFVESAQIGNIQIQKFGEYEALFTLHNLTGQNRWRDLYEKYKGNIAQIIHAINIIKKFFESDVSLFIDSSSTIFSEEAYSKIKEKELTKLDLIILELAIDNDLNTSGDIFRKLKKAYNNKYNSESIFDRFIYLENASLLSQTNGEILVPPIVKRFIMEGRFED